jgi:hypothetical protein
VSVKLLLQIAFAIGWTAGYVLWSRAYYRTVDPRLRALIGEWLGARLGWVHRQGTGGRPLRFGPRYATWTWGIADPHARTAVNDSLVYVLYVLIVPVLAGLWPVALLLGLVLGMRWLHPLITLVLLFAIIPIYSLYWAGRYQVPGMDAD